MYIGCTGAVCSGTHLHMTIKINGEAVDIENANYMGSLKPEADLYIKTKLY